MILTGALLLMVTMGEGPSTQDWVDLARYAGRWYEIARLPNRFQRQCAGDVIAIYTLRADGRVTVLNQCRKADGTTASAEGEARRADPDGPASRLKVRFAPGFLSFLPFVWGDYWILELDHDYRYALVGDPARKYLWFLSRTPTMDAATYESLTAAATRLGFDVARLERTPQSTR
ncbi:MAG TPA: lipocalin family protein [Vicinamibacteria bacterium]|nr:lipocalin family protein [Vicinamibacteria bacterium]